MTLFITFVPSYQYILAWATLHFPVLHHCINSVLCCKSNIHSAQGPKNDYTHAYNHPLSNLSPLQSLFLEPVSFLIINFPNFHSHPIASIELAVYYMNFLQIEALWPKHFKQTAKKLKALYILLKLSLLFIFLRLLLPWSRLLVNWSLVGAWYLTTIPTLSSFVPLFSTVVAFPHELPLLGTQLHRLISTSVLLHRY